MDTSFEHLGANLDLQERAQKVTIVSGGTALEVDGNFSVGATLAVWADDPFWIGSTAAEAQERLIGAPANTIIRIKLKGRNTTFFADAATGKIIYANQLSSLKSGS